MYILHQISLHVFRIHEHNAILLGAAVRIARAVASYTLRRRLRKYFEIEPDNQYRKVLLFKVYTDNPLASYVSPTKASDILKYDRKRRGAQFAARFFFFFLLFFVLSSFLNYISRYFRLNFTHVSVFLPPLSPFYLSFSARLLD